MYSRLKVKYFFSILVCDAFLEVDSTVGSQNNIQEDDTDKLFPYWCQENDLDVSMWLLGVSFSEEYLKYLLFYSLN